MGMIIFSSEVVKSFQSRPNCLFPWNFHESCREGSQNRKQITGVLAFLDKRPFALLLVGVAHCSPARCAHLMTELFGTALSNANARELRSLHPPHSSSVSLGTREDARGLATTVPRVPFAVLRTTNLRRKMQQHDLRVVARRHQKRQSGFFGRRP